ncbi:ankyrin repeat domain-containing protein [Candidatus Dojkabacteria bacterium]|jgi:serine/threonine-protein phosphatase 6 regulatory ankyrin repeat subunit B|nr:ankyrin repeat domain-containing protein [Candidatus Dojkabacteria bacterium]
MKYLKLFEAISESKIFNAISKNPYVNINYAKKLISTSSKSDLDYQDIENKSALSIASYYGILDIVKELIKAGANLNIQDSTGKTPLMLAIIKNEINIVKELIKAGADVNIKDNKNYYAIHWCNSYIYMEELIKVGADINVQDDDGNTVLIYAANNEHLSIVKELIKAGANVDIANYDDITALVCAAIKNNIKIVDILLKNRKNKNKLNKNDYHFFEYLSDENKKYIIDNFPTLYNSYLLLNKIEKYNI